MPPPKPEAESGDDTQQNEIKKNITMQRSLGIRSLPTVVEDIPLQTLAWRNIRLVTI